MIVRKEPPPLLCIVYARKYHNDVAQNWPVFSASVEGPGFPSHAQVRRMCFFFLFSFYASAQRTTYVLLHLGEAWPFSKKSVIVLLLHFLRRTHKYASSSHVRRRYLRIFSFGRLLAGGYFDYANCRLRDANTTSREKKVVVRLEAWPLAQPSKK